MSEGVSGTFEALSLMSAAVRGDVPPDYSGYRDPWIQHQVCEILIPRMGQRRDHSLEEAFKIYRWVRDNVEYFDHLPSEQVVQDARRTIELGTGDCVSQSVLLATLLAAASYQVQFAVQMPSIEEGYSHVYVDLIFEDQIISLDPIADGKDGRNWGEPGWSQGLPDGGFETSYLIF